MVLKNENNCLIYIEKGKYAPRSDLLFVERKNVAVIIKYLNQYLFLSWNEVDYQMSLVTGGINDEETFEDASRRETIEETGYYDIDSIIPIDALNISEFFVEHKNENRRAIYYPYLVTLKTLKRRNVTQEENKKHTCIWYDEKHFNNIDLFDNHRYMLNKSKDLTDNK